MRLKLLYNNSVINFPATESIGIMPCKILIHDFIYFTLQVQKNNNYKFKIVVQTHPVEDELLCIITVVFLLVDKCLMVC